MALPRIEAVVTADTANAESGFDRVGREADRMASRVDSASGRMAGMQRQMGRVSGSSGQMRMAIQNASFQLGDFAVMVGGGVDASRALATQLPQLLGPFGVLGAVMSAVVAIAIPLAGAIGTLTTESGEAAQVFGVLSPMIEAIGAAMGQIIPVVASFTETILNNLDRIIITAGVVATFFAGKWVAGFVAARLATLNLAAALATLRAALIRTGIGALVIAAGELVYQFTRLVQGAGGFGKALSMVGAVFAEVWQRMKQGVALLVEMFQGAAMIVQGAFQAAFAAIAQAFNSMVLVPITKGINQLVKAGQMLGLSWQELAIPDVGAGLAGSAQYNLQGGREIMDSAGSALGETFTAPLNSVQKIKDTLQSIKDEKITLPDLLGVGDEDGEGGSGGGKSKASKKLDEELTAQEERIKEHFDRIKALTQGGLSDKLGAWGDYFSNLVSLTGTQNDKLLRVAKAAKAAQALMDAWSAYNQVLADPSLIGRPFVRIAAAANVLAAGLGAVSAIKGVSAGGGGAGASAGASASAATAAPLEVRLSGLNHDQLYSGLDVDNLLTQLDERAGDRGMRLMVAK